MPKTSAVRLQRSCFTLVLLLKSGLFSCIIKQSCGRMCFRMGFYEYMEVCFMADTKTDMLPICLALTSEV